MVPEPVKRHDKRIGDTCIDEVGKETAKASVSRSQDPIRWGNEAGLATLEKFSAIEAKLNTLDNQVGALQVENKTLVERNESLSDRVGALEVDNMTLKITNSRQDAEIRELKETSPIWINIRNRFFAVYLRNSHNNLYKAQSQKSIKEEGDDAAHYGEPVADACLFKRGFRSDENIYVELYSLRYEEVLEIRKSFPGPDSHGTSS